jgi:hypothetical protein
MPTVFLNGGDNFHKHFTKLGRLHSFIPFLVPFLAASAILPSSILAYVQSVLQYSEDSTFLVNLGNDQPNILMVLSQMHGAAWDLEALEFVLDDTLTGNSLKWMMIFFNTRDLCQQAYKHLRKQLLEQQCEEVGFLHALQSTDAKCNTMK